MGKKPLFYLLKSRSSLAFFAFANFRAGLFDGLTVLNPPKKCGTKFFVSFLFLFSFCGWLCLLTLCFSEKQNQNKKQDLLCENPKESFFLSCSLFLSFSLSLSLLSLSDFSPETKKTKMTDKFVSEPLQELGEPAEPNFPRSKTPPSSLSLLFRNEFSNSFPPLL